MSAISTYPLACCEIAEPFAISRYGHCALDQEEELAPGPTLLDHCLALGPPNLVGEIRNHAEFLLRARGEERNSGDQVDLRVLMETHGAILTSIP